MRLGNSTFCKGRHECLNHSPRIRRGADDQTVEDARNVQIGECIGYSLIKGNFVDYLRNAFDNLRRRLDKGGTPPIGRIYYTPLAFLVESSMFKTDDPGHQHIEDYRDDTRTLNRAKNVAINLDILYNGINLSVNAFFVQIRHRTKYEV